MFQKKLLMGQLRWLLPTNTRKQKDIINKKHKNTPIPIGMEQ
jgi:hypothetical protein